LTSAAKGTSVRSAVGTQERGLKIMAPLSKLPTIQRGEFPSHVGRFHAARVFDRPLAARGLPFVEIHLKTSHAVPVTVYLNKRDKLRSDIQLMRGEQIVRIDLRNYRGTGFAPDKWDGHLQDISLDIWPQDMFHPYHEAQDVEVTLRSLRITNRSTDTAAKRADKDNECQVYLRANVPYGENVIRAVEKDCVASTLDERYCQQIGATYLGRGIGERFRSFTDQGTVAPAVCLLSG